jgi:transposase
MFLPLRMEKNMRKRRNYDSNFRARVALEAVKGLRTIADISREYKLHPNLVIKWKKELLLNLPKLFEKKENEASETLIVINEKLYNQVGKLTMEVEYYKKKLLV